MPLFFFFNDTATTEIYTLSLHDALPIYPDVIAELRHTPGYKKVKYSARRMVSRFMEPALAGDKRVTIRSEEHTSELQSPDHLVCRLLLEKKNGRLSTAG